MGNFSSFDDLAKLQHVKPEYAVALTFRRSSATACIAPIRFLSALCLLKQGRLVAARGRSEYHRRLAGFKLTRTSLLRARALSFPANDHSTVQTFPRLIQEFFVMKRPMRVAVTG